MRVKKRCFFFNMLCVFCLVKSSGTWQEEILKHCFFHIEHEDFLDVGYWSVRIARVAIFNIQTYFQVTTDPSNLVKQIGECTVPLFEHSFFFYLCCFFQTLTYKSCFLGATKLPIESGRRLAWCQVPACRPQDLGSTSFDKERRFGFFGFWNESCVVAGNSAVGDH